MTYRTLALLALIGCNKDKNPAHAGGEDSAGEEAPLGPVVFSLADERLPEGLSGENCMDVGVADVDGDGDLDVVLANEFQPNVLLINDGEGRFEEMEGAFEGDGQHDHEDVAFGDVNGDGVVDVVFAAEDDEHSELWLGAGGGFVDGSGALPAQTIADAVELADLDGDGSLDLLIGGHGQELLFLGAGDGAFTDATAGVPDDGSVTQDIELGDLDGDGDLDAVLANESLGAVLLNNGDATFEVVDLPERDAPEETRKAALGDVDGDGDLDLVLANVGWQAPSDAERAQDRLLLNDGSGGFSDATERLPVEARHTLSARLVDAEGDGDLDLFTAEVEIEGNALAPGMYRLLENDGYGYFTDVSAERMPGVTGFGLDLEPADLTGDGIVDLYLCSRGEADHLLVGARVEAEE